MEGIEGMTRDERRSEVVRAGSAATGRAGGGVLVASASIQTRCWQSQLGDPRRSDIFDS